MSTLVRPGLRTQIKRVVSGYRNDDTNRMNLLDVRSVLDLWFTVVDRFRR